MYLTSTLAACREAAQGRTHNRVEIVARCPGCHHPLRMTDRNDPDLEIEYHTTSTCTHPDPVVLDRRGRRAGVANQARQERRMARKGGRSGEGLTSSRRSRSLGTSDPAPRRTGHTKENQR